MKKINLGGIQSAPSSARASHPTVEADAELQKFLEQFAEINPRFKMLENQTKTLSKQIGPRIKALFFGRFSGITPESSTMLVTAGGKTIKLITKDSYSKSLDDDRALITALAMAGMTLEDAAEFVSRQFRQATILKLDLDKCPEDKQEDFAQGVLALAKSLGASDCVSASQCIQPKAGFHEARTSLLTPAQNVAIDALLPITAYPQI